MDICVLKDQHFMELRKYRRETINICILKMRCANLLWHIQGENVYEGEFYVPIFCPVKKRQIPLRKRCFNRPFVPL